MSAEIHVFRCLEDNIGALVHDPSTGACAAIDAPEEGPILAALAERGWTLSDILVTHRHSDHVQAIPALKQRTGCRVVAPVKSGAEVPAVDAWVREGDTVHVGDLQAHVWETPGHCADQCRSGSPPTGRSLPATRSSRSAADGCWTARSPRSGPRSSASPHCRTRRGSIRGTTTSCRTRVSRLRSSPGNEALKARAAEAERAKAEGRFLVPSTIGAEKATNPFLRAGEPAVARAVEMEGRDPGRRFSGLARMEEQVLSARRLSVFIDPENVMTLAIQGLNAQDIVRQLDLRPHPEGGFYRETFRDAREDEAGRAASTAIYYLLGIGEVSRMAPGRRGRGLAFLRRGAARDHGLAERARCLRASSGAGSGAGPASAIRRAGRPLADGDEPRGLDARRLHRVARLRVRRLRTRAAGLAADTASASGRDVSNALVFCAIRANLGRVRPCGGPGPRPIGGMRP